MYRPSPSEDTSTLIYDEISEQYVATVKQRTVWGRSVWLSTSVDFVDWTEPKLILHTDEIDRANRKRRIQEVVENPGVSHTARPRRYGLYRSTLHDAVDALRGVIHRFPVTV